jgi:hypothetical protein
LSFTGNSPRSRFPTHVPGFPNQSTFQHSNAPCIIPLVLAGFICSRCRAVLSKLLSETFVQDIELLISKTWIGSREEHTSIATNTKKLGYDLFVTKGIEPTVFERLTILVEKEGVKTILNILAALAIAGLLLWFGLRGT